MVGEAELSITAMPEHSVRCFYLYKLLSGKKSNKCGRFAFSPLHRYVDAGVGLPELQGLPSLSYHLV